MIEDRDIAIRIRGLETRFGSQVIHQGLDLDVRRGEVLGVVGGSGTGKSVLLRTVVGLRRPDAGRIEVLGRELGALGMAERSRFLARLGVLFQDGALFSGMTVAENVAVPLREHARLARPLVDDLVRVKIGMSGLPPDAAAKMPAELSGGMRKRAGLARALALDPEILFLDEPTAGLDPIVAAGFDGLVRNLQRSLGLTVFLVTHDLDTLVAVCDRIAVLVERQVVVGTLDELLDHPHPWIQSYFRGPRGRAAREPPD